MDGIRVTYRAGDDGNDKSNNENSDIVVTDPTAPPTTTIATDGAATIATTTIITTTTSSTTPDTETEPLTDAKEEPISSEDLSDDKIPDNPQTQKPQDEKNLRDSPKFTKVSEDDDDDDEEPPPKKQKQLSSFTSQGTWPQVPAIAEQSEDKAVTPTPAQPTTKRIQQTQQQPPKGNNLWTKSTSRKGKKKTKNNNHNAQTEDTVLITPIPRFPDKTDDATDMKICLSKLYKAEKVELSDDRLSAGSTKGYRMVRATRGVVEGAWYFEIKVVKLGDTGHTRLGWSMEKGDLQAPVGYDANSFGYRDIDGSKIHKAFEGEVWGTRVCEGDIIGFYINLLEGSSYAPKPPHLVWYKGQRYLCAPDGKEDPPKLIPGSEVSFFKKWDMPRGCFSGSLRWTILPCSFNVHTSQSTKLCCQVLFPEDFGGSPIPRPMIEVPYHGYNGKVENGVSSEKKH